MVLPSPRGAEAWGTERAGELNNPRSSGPRMFARLLQCFQHGEGEPAEQESSAALRNESPAPDGLACRPTAPAAPSRVAVAPEAASTSPAASAPASLAEARAIIDSLHARVRELESKATAAAFWSTDSAGSAVATQGRGSSGPPGLAPQPSVGEERTMYHAYTKQELVELLRKSTPSAAVLLQAVREEELGSVPPSLLLAVDAATAGGTVPPLLATVLSGKSVDMSCDIAGVAARLPPHVRMHVYMLQACAAKPQLACCNAAARALFEVRSDRQMQFVLEAQVQQDAKLAALLQELLDELLKLSVTEIDAYLTKDISRGSPIPRLRPVSHFVNTSNTKVFPFIPIMMRACGYLKSNGDVVPCVIIDFAPDSNQGAFLQHLQRDYTMMHHLNSIVTLFDMKGNVVHQNAGSIQYFGYQRNRRADAAVARSSAAHADAQGGSELTALEQLFALATPDTMESMLEAMVAGGVWKSILPVPPSLVPATRPPLPAGDGGDRLRRTLSDSFFTADVNTAGQAVHSMVEALQGAPRLSGADGLEGSFALRAQQGGGGGGGGAPSSAHRERERAGPSLTAVPESSSQMLDHLPMPRAMNAAPVRKRSTLREGSDAKHLMSQLSQRVASSPILSHPAQGLRRSNTSGLGPSLSPLSNEGARLFQRKSSALAAAAPADGAPAGPASSPSQPRRPASSRGPQRRNNTLALGGGDPLGLSHSTWGLTGLSGSRVPTVDRLPSATAGSPVAALLGMEPAAAAAAWRPASGARAAGLTATQVAPHVLSLIPSQASQPSEGQWHLQPQHLLAALQSNAAALSPASSGRHAPPALPTPPVPAPVVGPTSARSSHAAEVLRPEQLATCEPDALPGGPNSRSAPAPALEAAPPPTLPVSAPVQQATGSAWSDVQLRPLSSSAQEQPAAQLSGPGSSGGNGATAAAGAGSPHGAAAAAAAAAAASAAEEAPATQAAAQAPVAAGAGDAVQAALQPVIALQPLPPGASLQQAMSSQAGTESQHTLLPSLSLLQEGNGSSVGARGSRRPPVRQSERSNPSLQPTALQPGASGSSFTQLGPSHWQKPGRAVPASFLLLLDAGSGSASAGRSQRMLSGKADSLGGLGAQDGDALGAPGGRPTALMSSSTVDITAAGASAGGPGSAGNDTDKESLPLPPPSRAHPQLLQLQPQTSNDASIDLRAAPSRHTSLLMTRGSRMCETGDVASGATALQGSVHAGGGSPGGGGTQKATPLAEAALAADGAVPGLLNGDVYHEVTATSFMDPVSKSQSIMVVQTDVTARVRLERRLGEVMAAEHKLLEHIFPRHVLEYIANSAALCPTSASQLNLSMLSAMPDPTKTATDHEMVTLLFADLVGFTDMCKQVSAKEVMLFLDRLYSKFDQLLDIYSVYKVETIGDCYVCAGGLVAKDEDGYAAVRKDSTDKLQAWRVLKFAQAMLRDAATVMMPTTGEPVKMRVGIHTGPVVSGIVGRRMPRFCLFGDTINTASRMESTCPHGAIQVSAATHALVPDEEWEATGGIQVKGKGLMHTYILRPGRGNAVPEALAAASQSSSDARAAAERKTYARLAMATVAEADSGSGGSMGGRSLARGPSGACAPSGTPSLTSSACTGNAGGISAAFTARMSHTPAGGLSSAVMSTATVAALVASGASNIAHSEGGKVAPRPRTGENSFLFNTVC